MFALPEKIDEIDLKNFDEIDLKIFDEIDLKNLIEFLMPILCPCKQKLQLGNYIEKLAN